MPNASGPLRLKHSIEGSEGQSSCLSWLLSVILDWGFKGFRSDAVSSFICLYGWRLKWIGWPFLWILCKLGSNSGETGEPALKTLQVVIASMPCFGLNSKEGNRERCSESVRSLAPARLPVQDPINKRASRAPIVFLYLFLLGEVGRRE